MKALLIEVNGEVNLVDLPDYEALNKAVGGYLEGINFGDTGHFCYINEDGIALSLPYNRKATELCKKYRVGLMEDDFIKGTMVVVGPPDKEGNETDVSDALIAELIFEKN